ncbi:MAG: amidohydrolase family protein [Rhizobiaceae bacterium]
MIDAHHHLWNPLRGDYGWMPKDNPILSRKYGIDDLVAVARQNDISRTVLVQAAPSVNETEYMLGIADSSELVGGVVGWVDFEDQADRRQLERLCNHPKLKSIRPMVQDIEDDLWVLRKDIRWAFDAIVDLGLRFDALGFPRHSAPFLEVFQLYPGMKVVIDHCMKPQIADDGFDDWAGDIEKLASQTGALIKLSGLVTEAGNKANQPTMQPYVDHVVSCFGADRIMWGSDWPVSRLSMEYGDWLGLARQLTDHLSETDNKAIFTDTAAGFYGLT